MRGSALESIVAFAAACFLVFVVRVQELNLQPLLGTFDDRWFRHYTPYFPGLDHLDQHEIFSPRYAQVKKIVLLGSSVVDSIGCDETWSRPDAGQHSRTNAAYGCSIAAQLNDLLQADGLTNWRAFNLARNGAKLTPMLYTYARIASLKPKIVIYGDAEHYYMWANADADALKPEHYAYMRKVLASRPDTAAIWRDYLGTLRRHGWSGTDQGVPAAAIDFSLPRRRTSLQDILVHLLGRVQNMALRDDDPPFPVKIDRTHRLEVSNAAFHNADPGLAYFRGILLLADNQKRNGGKFFFYFSPDHVFGRDRAYLDGIDRTYGRFLRDHEIPYASYIGMDLRANVETYDGIHQTIYGNRRIAAALLHDLIAQRLISRAP